MKNSKLFYEKVRILQSKQPKTEEQKQREREHRKYMEETKEERKINREYDRRERQRVKEAKAEQKAEKIRVKREIELLQFMLKNDTRYYHHGRSDSLNKEIQQRLDRMKEDKRHDEYNNYIWNYQGEGKNYMPKSQLGYLWGSSEFNTIYDVPLDGSYVFYTYDSGQRGCGSFDYITVKKVEVKATVPYVNPGGFPQITV
jgi:DNA repair exonuclease SbcCD ATPase subunit